MSSNGNRESNAAKSVAHRPQLTLAAHPALYRREEAVFDEGDPHSLHFGIAYPESVSPDFAAFFIRKYTNKGDVVVDPFCASGTVALEAAMQGRVAWLSDPCGLHVKIASARLFPADITEITLRLGDIPTKKLVAIGADYREYFQHYYDPETYRELCNLRQYLLGRRDRISACIEALTLGLLHGPTAGFLSAPSSAAVTVPVEEQAQINYRRNQFPDYRAVAPRLLKRMAAISRDGIPSSMRETAQAHRAMVADPRSLAAFATNSVKLVVTAPPGIGGVVGSRPDQALRHWFSDVEPTSSDVDLSTEESWAMYMNEVLFELARVVRGGGRCCLVIDDVSGRMEQVLLQEIEQSLAALWIPEGVIFPRAKKNVIKPFEGSETLKGIIIKRL